MGSFSNKGKRYSDNGNNKGIMRSKLPIILIFSGIAAAIIIIAVILIVKPSNQKNTKETLFIEQEKTLIKDGEIIQINDPELGLIEIEAVKGAPKNTYDQNGFKDDENGYKSYYIDKKEASCTGIDLSEYQGDIDFEAVKNSGVDYVMLRLGGRYYSDEGDMYKDAMFDTYYENAKKVGLKVGAYFFSQASNVEDGIEEAQFAVSILNGKELDYPIAFDWEIISDDSARTDTVTGEDLTDIAIAFCKTLNEKEYKSIIYSNTSLMYYMYDLSKLKEYDFWVADYAELPSMYYNFTMWQYTTEGTVPGINGTVDLNICFKNY